MKLIIDKEKLRKRFEKIIKDTGLAFEDWEMDTLLNALTNSEIIKINLKNITPATDIEIEVSEEV